MRVKVGQQLHSAVSDAQLVVVRAPDADIDLQCGGTSLLEEPGAHDTEVASVDAPEASLLITLTTSSASSCCARARELAHSPSTAARSA